MFSSVLIANRGEIAVRIARTARRLGMRVIGVYSHADREAMHVRACDEAHDIGPAPARESYLAIDKIIDAAQRSGAQCIHPGYGFLSENPDLAAACDKAGIVFVGPPVAAIRAMGLKDQAKALMQASGVPVVPGYHGERQDGDFLLRQAQAIGFPVLIKAVAGGGGKGLRYVKDAAEFPDSLAAAQREARSAFGDPRVLVEKYIATPRHIEIQVFADRHGNVIHLNERDCSLQRRHQKVIEEAPAPGMTDEVRAAMGRAAVEAARAVGYVGAGTIEFIADGSAAPRADGFWFMEMNTRLQVEHPVTEAITGVDLVEWQFRVAAGEPLPLMQDQIAITGHAVEARIYAEDPERDFLPSSGRLVALAWPRGEGLRVDAGVEAGGEVTPFYDPMVAKVIAHGPTRRAALDRLSVALRQTVLLGPKSNIAFLDHLCRDKDVMAGRVDTGLIARHVAQRGPHAAEPDRAAAAAGVAELLRARASAVAPDAKAVLSPWDATDGFQLSGVRAQLLPVVVDDHNATATVTFAAAGITAGVDGVAADPQARAVIVGEAVYVARAGRQTIVRLRDPAAFDAETADESGAIASPMHGRVLAVMAEPGMAVSKGQRLALIEAMKMEHTLTAPFDGVVAEVAAAAGEQVAEGAIILRIARAGE